MSDDDKIFSCLARMRGPMIEVHPDWSSACVSDTLECALSLEVFQQECLNKINALKLEKSKLEASRFAYASEFDGDEGSIHQNIRYLKEQNKALKEALRMLNGP